MRIALIAETFTTGVGRHVADLMTALCQRGHEVHLLHGERRVDADLVQQTRALPGAQVMALPMRRAPHPQDLQSLWALARYLRRHGPFDVLHGHSSKGGAYARLLAPWLRARCLYTPHALVTLAPDLGRGARGLFATVERLLAPFTHHIVCCSSVEQAHAVALGLGARRCVVVPNGVDPFRSAALGVRARCGLAPDTLLAGFIGRLESQKAPDLLVESIGLLQRRNTNIHFAIAGDGALRAALEHRLAQLGATAAVTWLGAVDGRRLLAELDLLVMPSRYEGFPYTLLEALHCGVPVVATPVGGVDEINPDNACGLVVPHGDAPALADAIDTLTRDRSLRLRMATQARRRAGDFGVPAMADRIEALYGAGLPAVPSGT